MKENIFKNIYVVFMGVLAVSLLMLLGMYDMTPFNLSIAWSGAGTLTMARYETVATAGDRVVGNGDVAGKVNAYRAENVFRKEGTLYYQVVDDSVKPMRTMTVPANKYNRVSVASIPLLGVWVRALGYPIGIMALVGVPLSMLFINMLLIVGRGLFPVVSVLGEQTGSTRESAKGSTVVVSTTGRKRSSVKYQGQLIVPQY